MNNKIINTFKHGDTKTKTVLATMLAGLFISVALLVISIITFNGTLTFISIILLVLVLAYIFGTDFSKEAVEREYREKQKAEKRAERERKKAEEDDEPGALEWISDKKVAKGEGKEDEDEPEKHKGHQFDDPLAQYDEKKLKKVMVEYKVRQEHVMVLVDNCKKENITQCPGFLWKDKTNVFILLLEEEPRIIKYALSGYSDLKVKVNVQAKPSDEYDNMKNDTYVARLYSPLVPNYTQGEDPRTHRSTYKKNLYGVGPDIWLTALSIKNVLKILSLNPVLADSRVNTDNYGIYFKEVYIARLMYRDGIFTGNEYKDHVLITLSDLAANAGNDGEFIENLSQMQTNGLIPQEYVDYASQKRNIYRGQNKKAGKR